MSYRNNRQTDEAEEGQQTSRPVPPIAITDLRAVNGNGALRAFFAVAIGEGDDALNIKQCRLVIAEGKRPFVSSPQGSYTDRDSGETKYFSFVYFPAHWLPVITAAALDAYESANQRVPPRPVYEDSEGGYEDAF